MRKILSLTSKDFEQGFASGAEQTDLGLFHTASRVNPFITKGTLRWSITPEEMGAGTVVGIPQSFAFSVGDAYSNDASGNIYKIADVFGTPTVTKPKTGLTNTYGLEVFQTLNSLKYLYYWQKTQIGRMKISDGSFTDNWKAITAAYQSDVNPTIRIDDEIYFGSLNVVSKIVDTGADTDLVENVLDLPKDYIITSLSTDGDYLIIVASKSISATLEYSETRVYFWDYKNALVSWTRSYPIQDIQIRGTITVAGVTYAVGQYGLYAFTFSQEPQRIREDVNCTVGYGNISRIKNAVSFGDDAACVTYGKLKPGVQTAVFKPYVLPANIACLNTSVSNATGIFGCADSKMYRQGLFTAPTTYPTLSFLTSKIDLGNLYAIKKIEVIFNGALATNDTMLIQVQGNSATATFNTIAHSTYGALYRAISEPSAGDIQADAIALAFRECAGSFRIRQIDVYGEEITRSN